MRYSEQRMRLAVEEARGDDNDDVDDSSERPSGYAGYGWRPTLRTTDAIWRNDEEK